MENTMDKIHKGILKKFHTLCSVLGMSEADKKAIVHSYGVESSRDIDTHDLIDVCARLSEQQDRQRAEKARELDRLRKQCMAAIGGWLRTVGRESNANVIKGIACRATGHADFNRIPKERLRNLIHTFNDKVKDRRAVNDAVSIMVVQNLISHGTGETMRS
ncbi:MAG: hypothetical protein LUC33_03855 [Prevotellaceae bacterium]|nr:hypothetical protein [Prevotellaceae bacterium]